MPAILSNYNNNIVRIALPLICFILNCEGNATLFSLIINGSNNQMRHEVLEKDRNLIHCV